MSRWVTTADVRRMALLRSRGDSYAEIGRATGFCAATVQRYCYLHCEPPGPRDRDRLPESEPELRRLHGQGLRLAALARRLRVCPATVRSWLCRLGLPLPALPRSGGRMPLTDAHKEKMARRKSEHHRRVCERLGWPEVVVPAQARILAFLARSGPRTHEQIAAGCGWKTFPRPGRAPRCPELGRHLRALTMPFGAGRDRRSYVARLPGRPALYAVADWLLARKEEP